MNIYALLLPHEMKRAGDKSNNYYNSKVVMNTDNVSRPAVTIYNVIWKPVVLTKSQAMLILM